MYISALSKLKESTEIAALQCTYMNSLVPLNFFLHKLRYLQGIIRKLFKATYINNDDNLQSGTYGTFSAAFGAPFGAPFGAAFGAALGSLFGQPNSTTNTFKCLSLR